MLEIMRTVASDLLEAPEEAFKLTGQALNAMGDMMEAMSKRIEALEKMVQGSGPSS